MQPWSRTRISPFSVRRWIPSQAEIAILTGSLLCISGCSGDIPKNIDVRASQPSQDAMKIPTLFNQFCWVAYAPTEFDPTTNPIQWPSEESIRKDLKVLHGVGFRGLVTYGSNYMNRQRPEQTLDIPKFAQSEGFEAVIVGIWDPNAENEVEIAKQASRHEVVVGYSVGNEGLGIRYELDDLVTTMQHMRQVTGKPVTTTEEFPDYIAESPLWEISDWIFPNVHPYFAGVRSPKEAAEWTDDIFHKLSSMTDKSVIFKEVGLPTSDESRLNESSQAQYYSFLQTSDVQYAVFEGFDAPWKHLESSKEDDLDPEPHWGVFTHLRQPKEATKELCTQ